MEKKTKQEIHKGMRREEEKREEMRRGETRECNGRQKGRRRAQGKSTRRFLGIKKRGKENAWVTPRRGRRYCWCCCCPGEGRENN